MLAHGGWETGHIATLILILDWSGQLYASAALPREEEASVNPLNRRL